MENRHSNYSNTCTEEDNSQDDWQWDKAQRELDTFSPWH